MSHNNSGKGATHTKFDPCNTVLTSTATLLREYIWHDGVPVAVVENDAVYFIRTDHIGRPVMATDDTGTKVWEANYLPFGGVQASTGSNSELRFPGQWFQSESGLHQNWMREYDPTLGRYIQADPLGLVDGPSVYGYAHQNPGRYIDPTGEFIPLLAAAASGFLGGYGGFVAGCDLGKMLFGDQCFALGDLGSSLSDLVPGVGPAKGGMNLAKALGKGGGKNATKRRADKVIAQIDNKIANAKKRLKQQEAKPLKSPKDKKAISKTKKEIKSLVDKRRRSEEQSRGIKR